RCVTRYCSLFCFLFSSRRRHTRSKRDWSSDVCSSDLPGPAYFAWSAALHCGAQFLYCPKNQPKRRRIVHAPQILPEATQSQGGRSEERRVGKEWRSRCAGVTYRVIKARRGC